MICSRFHMVSIPHYPISPDIHQWFKPQRLFTVTSVTFLQLPHMYVFLCYPRKRGRSLLFGSEVYLFLTPRNFPSPTVATCPFWVMLTKHWLSSPRSPVDGWFQSFQGSGTVHFCFWIAGVSLRWWTVSLRHSSMALSGLLWVCNRWSMCLLVELDWTVYCLFQPSSCDYFLFWL